MIRPIENGEINFSVIDEECLFSLGPQIQRSGYEWVLKMKDLFPNFWENVLWKVILGIGLKFGSYLQLPQMPD